MSKKKQDRANETPPVVQEDLPWNEDSQLLKWGLPAFTGLAIFLVYLRTLAPTIVGGDSGEFITVAYKMGVAHPPGYPLFTILAKLFTFIPFGTVAWRVNLLSAVCDTGAAVMILLGVRRWARNHWAGLLAAGLFAFSPLIWHYAVVGEVFALNNFLVASMLYLAVRYAEKREPKYAYLTALAFGLGMSNHHTCLFYGVPIMLWILITGRKELWSLKPLALIAGSFVIGLLPYLYLPLADRRAAPLSWGNASTLKGFFAHVLRLEYGTFKLGGIPYDTRGNFLLGLGKYFSGLPKEVLYIGIVLAVIGPYYCLRHKRFAGLMTATLAAFCTYMIVFHALADLPLWNPMFLEIHARFWQQATLLVCIWAGLGLAALASFVPRTKTINIIILVVALLVPFAQAVANFQKEDQHQNLFFRDWGHEVLRPLPDGSILLSKGDLMTYVLSYLQQCEGYRTDVRVLEQDYLKYPWMKRQVNTNYPDIVIPGSFLGLPGNGGYVSKQLFDANADRSKIFVNMDPYFFQVDTSWGNGYSFLPYGSVMMLTPTSRKSNPDYIQESRYALPNVNQDVLAKYPEGTWENLIFKDYWNARLERASVLLRYGGVHKETSYTLAAAAGYEDIIARLPNPPPIVFKLLGLAYSRLIDYDPANREKMKAVWLRYLQLSPPNDPDLDGIREAVNGN